MVSPARRVRLVILVLVAAAAAVTAAAGLLAPRAIEVLIPLQLIVVATLAWLTWRDERRPR